MRRGGVLAVAVGACTTERRRAISGREIDRSSVERIVPNETTKAEVDEWLGPPTKIQQGLASSNTTKVGVGKTLVGFTSLGEANPIVPTKDGVGEPKNRRVEIVVR